METSGAAGAGGAGSNVPAFLTKLWTLVEDPDTDALICWSPSGNSFHVFDQGQFAKEVLPKYFKHNNMASFVRQLNMYGFRKVIHIEQGGLVKPEKDDTEFQHPYFLRGQEHLLENIKRKVTNVSGIKSEEIKVRQDSVTKLLTDVQVMKGKQESMDSKLIAMKHENEALWREVASLRQKHAQQQKVVNKLIQFLISLVQSNRILGVKRKIPLMLNDSSSAHPMPKFSRQYSLEHVHGAPPFSAASPAYSGSTLYSPDSSTNCGPIISDVTELAQSSPSASPRSSLDGRSSPAVQIKEEPPSPARSPQPEEVSPVGAPPAETPLSPSAFIDSILQEEEPGGPLGTAAPATQPPAPEKCLSVACLDKNELNEHLDTIDSSLDNLQAMLTTHGFSVDTSALLDVSCLPGGPRQEGAGPGVAPPAPHTAPPPPPRLSTALQSFHDRGGYELARPGQQPGQYPRPPLLPGAAEAGGGGGLVRRRRQAAGALHGSATLPGGLGHRGRGRRGHARFLRAGGRARLRGGGGVPGGPRRLPPLWDRAPQAQGPGSLLRLSLGQGGREAGGTGLPGASLFRSRVAAAPCSLWPRGGGGTPVRAQPGAWPLPQAGALSRHRGFEKQTGCRARWESAFLAARWGSRHPACGTDSPRIAAGVRLGGEDFPSVGTDCRLAGRRKRVCPTPWGPRAASPRGVCSQACSAPGVAGTQVRCAPRSPHGVCFPWLSSKGFVHLHFDCY
uniref:Heat shock transcription factor 1 n=1 Tax=Varanus komodoensis TaxID=61221 RepID=A0A8D2J5P7_VARKO